MLWRNLFLSLFVAVLMVAGGASFSYAGDLKISGFADIILTLSDEANDNPPGAGTDADGKPANSTELKTGVTAEVDFEYTEGPVTFRLDLNLPQSGNPGIEAQGAGLGPNVGPHGVGIEQAKFVWAIPGGDRFGLSLTGGAFNAPIGFEAQDAPDMYQTSNGQLFDLVPSNLAGLMISGGTGPVALDVYFANEWVRNEAEENSIGGLLTITPNETASLAIGYITSPESKTAAGVAQRADENVLDVVLTGELSGLTVTPNITDVVVLGALEYLTDENNDAFAVVLNVTHNTAHPHGLTIRYDSVDCDGASGTNPGSTYCSGIEATPTSLTVAASVAIADNLSALVEWKTSDPDIADDPSTTTVDESESVDLFTLEFVATF